MTRAMVTSRVGKSISGKPVAWKLAQRVWGGREGHTCSALGEPELIANATRLAPTLHKAESLPYPNLVFHG
jgi:hypothetical protein